MGCTSSTLYLWWNYCRFLRPLIKLPVLIWLLFLILGLVDCTSSTLCPRWNYCRLLIPKIKPPVLILLLINSRFGGLHFFYPVLVLKPHIKLPVLIWLLINSRFGGLHFFNPVPVNCDETTAGFWNLTLNILFLSGWLFLILGSVGYTSSTLCLRWNYCRLLIPVPLTF